MQDSSKSYENWRDFFSKRLVDSGAFSLTDTYSRDDTEIEIYSALKGDPETTIKVGYFSAITLIYIHIINSRTPGNNRRQEIEHLYKYEFDEVKHYGPPGLDFEENNIQGISNILDEGFNGEEIVYYRNGSPVKSQLTTSYYPDSPKSTITYYFNSEFFLKRLLKRILAQKDTYYSVKKINLRDVFGGLNGS